MTAVAGMAAVASTSKPARSVIDDLMPTDEDLLYEEELLRNPFSLKMWWRYIQARSEVAAKRRYLLYERALKALPGSYKLWHAYLSERRTAARGLRPDHSAVTALLHTYERALVSMHKMPRIWLEYLELLVSTGAVTATRRAFDKALAALPITQHDRIWVLYLKFVRQPGMPADTAVRVYRRYLKLEPAHVEEYIAYCKAHEMWGEAAKRLAQVLDDDTFRSLEGKSKHTLWLELCDIITRHPRDVQGLNVDAILRGGIRKFTDEVGRLWTSLADYYIRLSLFERARDVYEEGLGSVTTVRDFGLVFDALTHFEESLLAAKLANDEDDDDEAAPSEADDGANFLLTDDGDDTDLRLARLEALAGRRPELLSSVMLRQNPHNVGEWHKRVKLFEGQPTKQILTYTEAVKTVDIDKALGKPHSLWVAFARFYERHGDVVNARVIFDKATQVQYKYVDDLATVYTEWAEMELRHHNYRSAVELLARATAAPQRTKRLTQEEERQLPVQQRLYRSNKLWSLYADLVESTTDGMEETSAVYDRMLELRIATPQTVLNYALFLQEHKHWEDSFRVYERGISLFKYPHVEDIWTAYLKQFVERYGGTKLERARDLYEQALSMAPPAKALPLFLQYAALEEAHGLARHAMEMYARALGVVPKEQRLSVVDVYAARASDFFGVAKVREVYEAAVEAEPPADLPPDAVRVLCLRYAQLERKLGEVDRARAILIHGSHLANPRRDTDYWNAWNEFEVRHGNEDTFRDMLRIKRSVAASYSQMHIDSAAKVAEITPDTEPAGVGIGAKRAREEGDSMAALEASLTGGTKLSGFVSAGVIQQGKQEGQQNGGAGGEAAAAANPEEMDLGDEDEEEGAEGAAGGAEGDDEEDDTAALEQKAVPAAVFGSLAAQAAETAGEGEQLGALERFKKRRVEGS